MKIIKKIFEIFFQLLGLLICGGGLWLLIVRIIESPTYVPCYVGAIFLATVTVVYLFYLYCSFYLPFPSFQPKPKTFSIYIVIWLLVVIYVCGLGGALLWWGFTVAEHLRGLLMAFAIFLTALGGAALGGLFWQLAIRRKNKFILQHGMETEAIFVDSYPSFRVHFGKETAGTDIFQYCITFIYYDGEKEIIAKSHAMYTKAEARYFEETETFFVRYIGTRAVISQLPEIIDQE